MSFTAHLDDKAILEVSGPDAKAFLQNLISNDMNEVTNDVGLYAFLLSAQGKYLHDFFIVKAGVDQYLLEVASTRLADLKRRLSMLKLRADVTVSELPDMKVYAIWPIENEAGNFKVSQGSNGIDLLDGRDLNLCKRKYAPEISENLNATASDIRNYLADKGVATGHLDFIIDKSTIMEAGLDGQFAVSWTKGCFVGQELTARMKYRGLVKRLLVPTQQPVRAETNLQIDGKSVGAMQSDRFALIKRDAINFDDSQVQTVEGQAVSFVKPVWWTRAEATATKT